MTKKGIRAFVVLIFLGFLLTGAGKGMIFDAGSDVNAMESQAAETERNTEDVGEFNTENDSGISFSEYSCLNEDSLLDSGFLETAGRELIDKGMALASEEVKGDFVPVVPEDCSFPKELVVAMEDIFYHSSSYLARESDDSYYKEKLKDLGSEKFKVEQEEERNRVEALLSEEQYFLEGCSSIYHFRLTEETDNYIFVKSNMGSSHIEGIDIYLMERVGDTLEKRCSFEAESHGDVIQYGGEFYFITWEENDALREIEGLRIHRLNGNPKEETLCIRYLPKEYVWTTSYSIPIYSSDTPSVTAQKERKSDAIYEYAKQVENEFAQGSYLRTDEEDGVRTEIYYGDEKDAESLEISDYYGMGYQVDVANCGLPVYVSKKREWERPNSEYLGVRFFYYDSVENDFEELEKLSCGTDQLWFKEIWGMIYVCRMYHICDFNYIFNMVLLEKDGENVESNIVYSATVIPKRKFVVTEGPVNVNRLKG